MFSSIRPDAHPEEKHDPGQALSVRQTGTLTDAFMQGQMQSWVNLDIHQLGAGAYQAACTFLTLERMHLVHEQQNRLIHKTGALPKNICTISFALGQDPLARFSHFKDPPSVTFLLPECTEIDILVPAHLDTLYLCLEQDRLLARGRILNPEFWDRPPQGLHAFNTPETGRLAAGLLSLLNLDASATLSAQAEGHLLDSALFALSESTEVLSCDTPEHKARRRAIQRVNRARDFIDASLLAGQVPSIVDLCVETGVSARTLQYAFREVMQMTPMTYLRILRLNKVRSLLRAATAADVTVTHIAMDWGFFQLGEFARDYFQLFGEYPSETLTRGRSLSIA